MDTILKLFHSSPTIIIYIPSLSFPMSNHHAMKSGVIIPHYLKTNGKLDALVALPLSEEPKNSLAKKEDGHQTWFTHEAAAAAAAAADSSQLCWKFNLSSSPKLVMGILLHVYFPSCQNLEGICLPGLLREMNSISEYYCEPGGHSGFKSE
jgi:hypothetical protein